jgi:hypothetical protein
MSKLPRAIEWAQATDPVPQSTRIVASPDERLNVRWPKPAAIRLGGEK